jgi:hypothetical protein
MRKKAPFVKGALLLEQGGEFGLGRRCFLRFVRAVFKCEVRAVIGSFAIRDVLGDVFSALIVLSWIPVLAVATAIHVLTAVRADICALHFDSIKIELVAAFVTEMMSFFYLGYVHCLFPNFFSASHYAVPVFFGTDVRYTFFP